MLNKLSNKFLDRVTKIFKATALILVSLALFVHLFGAAITTIASAAMVIIVPALIALILMYLLEPIVEFIIKKTNVKRIYAVILVMVLLFIGVGAFGAFFGIFVWEQAANFFNIELVNGIKQIFTYVQTIIPSLDFGKVTAALSDIIPIVTSVFSSAVSIGMTLVLVPVFLLFFLSDKTKVFNGVLSVFPEGIRKHLSVCGSRSNVVIRAYFRGKIISMVFIWIYFTIAFFILGLGQYAFLFALLLTVLDLIPYIGPTVGVGLPILYVAASSYGADPHVFHMVGFEVSGLGVIVGIIIANAIGQFLQNNAIVPLFVGKEMSIPTLLILVSMLFFGGILGIWGVLLSIPLCGIIKVIVEYYKEVNCEISANIELKTEEESDLTEEA